MILYDAIIEAFALFDSPTTPTREQFNRMVSDYPMAILVGEINCILISMESGNAYLGYRNGYPNTYLFVDGKFIPYIEFTEHCFLKSFDKKREEVFHQYIKQYFS